MYSVACSHSLDMLIEFLKLDSFPNSGQLSCDRTVLGGEVGCGAEDFYSVLYPVHTLMSSALAQLPLVLPLWLQRGWWIGLVKQWLRSLLPYKGQQRAGKGCDIGCLQHCIILLPPKPVWLPWWTGFHCAEKLNCRVLQRVHWNNFLLVFRVIVNYSIIFAL